MITTVNSYFAGNDLAASVWKGKYALKDQNKKLIESSPDEMHRRMAREFARVEANYPNAMDEETIYNLLVGFGKIIPQGSVMSQLGNPHQIGSLSNCIVLPKIHDSYGGILYTDQQLAQVMKRRCGAGVDISTLRPSGTIVSNAAQSSTGAISFMHRFSNTTREVAQDGRRGALMISLDIRHPEAKGFATIKQDLTKVTGANISLKITDEFMICVENDLDFTHRFPVDSPIENAQTVVVIKAKELWDVIVDAAHKSAEPGLIFWDRQHNYSPSSLYREFCNISTNPCSEIAMGNDSCRLIALNMFACVVNPFTPEATFNFDLWHEMNYQGMKLMDDLVDLEIEHIDRILAKIDADTEPDFIKQVERETWQQLRETGRRGRRTGLGYTALGDTFAALGLKYDSDDALTIFKAISQTKLRGELDATIDMAADRGAFEAWDGPQEAIWAQDESTFFYMLAQEFSEQWERMQRVGRRNISWSTLAPTGSLSLLARLSNRHYGTTSGIEPVFKVFHIRRKKINPNDTWSKVDFTDQNGDKWQEFVVFHEGFKMWYEINNPNNFIEWLSKAELNAAVANSPYGGSQADEINWIKRVELQAIAQRYITHSISSTINLPNNVTTDEVSNIYFESWKRGLKGITVYRDGSRTGVLISESSTPTGEFVYHDAPKRPASLKGELSITNIKGQKYAVLVGLLNNKPYEVFAFNAMEGLDKQTGDIIKLKKGQYNFSYNGGIILPNIQEQALHADEQMLTRLVSGMLRHGVNPKFILEQIDKCPLEIVSFGKALARVIKKYVSDKELLERFKCKDCGSSNVRFEEGCGKCLDCGSSKCG